MTSGIVLGIGLCFNDHSPEQAAVVMAFHQPAANQLGGDQLGRAGEEALGEGSETLGGSGNGLGGSGSNLAKIKTSQKRYEALQEDKSHCRHILFITRSIKKS